jgi:hypothetical protein
MCNQSHGLGKIQLELEERLNSSKLALLIVARHIDSLDVGLAVSRSQVGIRSRVGEFERHMA